MIGRAFGLLPTDKAIRSLSPFQALWLYSYIKREEAEKKREESENLKLLCFMINPSASKKIFATQEEKEKQDVDVSEEDFIKTIKKMDKKFDVDTYKEITKDL